RVYFEQVNPVSSFCSALSVSESSNEPAKLAERVLAPGDGEAEPGVTATNLREPAQLATDAVDARKPLSPSCFSHVSSVAHFVGWGACWVWSPGSASPSPGASLS